MNQHPHVGGETQEHGEEQGEQREILDRCVGDRRLLVQRLVLPPLHRSVHDDHVDDEEEAHDGGSFGSHLRGAFEPPHSEIPERQHEEDERCEQTNIAPLPPGVPDRASPDRTGDECQSCGEASYLRRRPGDEIPPHRAILQNDRTSDCSDEEGQVGDDRGRHVDVDEAHRIELADLLAAGGIDSNIGIRGHKREVHEERGADQHGHTQHSRRSAARCRHQFSSINTPWLTTPSAR